jgi:hypothetical protein
MATLNVDVLISKENVEILNSAARIAAHIARIATLRELADDLNSRADVLEAAGASEKAQVPTLGCGERFHQSDALSGRWGHANPFGHRLRQGSATRRPALT